MQPWTFALAALIAGSVGATDPSELLKCSATSDSVKRLECFDGLVSSEQAQADKRASEDLGVNNEVSNWHTSVSQSKIDDSKIVSLLTASKNEVPNRFGKTSTPVLFLRCLENTTSAYITFDGLFMSDSSSFGDVTFRVDKTKAFTRSLSVSTNHKALGFWSGGTAIPFIKTIFSGDALTVQATPHNESPITMEFDISGLKDAVKPLRQACKW